MKRLIRKSFYICENNRQLLQYANSKFFTHNETYAAFISNKGIDVSAESKLI